MTTAIAQQIVVSVGAEPSDELLTQLTAELERLDAIDALGEDATPADVAAQVTAVQQGIDQLLEESGLLVPDPQDEETTGDEQLADPVDPAADAEPAPAPDDGSMTEDPVEPVEPAPTDPAPTEPVPDDGTTTSAATA